MIPTSLKLLARAFDAACRDKSNGEAVTAAEDHRTRLALIIVKIARAGARDEKDIKKNGAHHEQRGASVPQRGTSLTIVLTRGAQKEQTMAESVYKVIELVGTSTQSWELAAKVAVERAAQTLRDLRIAEIVAQDLVIEDGKVQAYRAKLKVSFKFEGNA